MSEGESDHLNNSCYAAYMYAAVTLLYSVYRYGWADDFTPVIPDALQAAVIFAVALGTMRGNESFKLILFYGSLLASILAFIIIVVYFVVNLFDRVTSGPLEKMVFGIRMISIFTCFGCSFAARLAERDGK